MKLTLDTHSKAWWVSITSLGLVLAQQVAHLFGWTIPAGTVNDVTAIINTLLTIGGAVGLIYDTSKGGKA